MLGILRETRGNLMKLAVIAALCVFWLAMAYRQFQRGDMLLAGIFVVVGVTLTAYRLRKAQ
jgi:hypothetical protein